MSKPNSRTWKCAIRTLQYLYKHKERGIKFRSDGSRVIQCYYDSSNKADPNDGKSQWGYVITLLNGPLDWGCRKHNHVGISSSHNEYMALSHATKSVIWIRQLLMEMKLEEFIPGATPMMGDNDQATNLAREDILTQANRYFRLEYHFLQRMFRSRRYFTT